MTDQETRQDRGCRVCPPGYVRWIDNWGRRLIHNPRKLFGPHVEAGMTVLDVGCGGGFTSIGMARLVGKEGTVIAADLQPEMLAFVAARAEKQGLRSRIRLHQCQADCIGVSSAVDFAVAFYMAHETPDQQAFFDEIFATLRPGGKFFLVEPKGHVTPEAFEETLTRACAAGFTVDERPKVLFSLAALLAKAGVIPAVSGDH